QRSWCGEKHATVPPLRSRSLAPVGMTEKARQGGMRSCGFAFAGGGEDGAEAVAYYDFFAGLDGHGDELDVVGGFDFFGGRLGGAFADGLDEAGIVGAEDLDAGVALAEGGDAVGEGEAPGLLIPGNFERGVTIAVVGN